MSILLSSVHAMLRRALLLLLYSADYIMPMKKQIAHTSLGDNKQHDIFAGSKELLNI